MIDRRFFFALAAFGLLLLYIFLVYSILGPFLKALTWSMVIGTAAFPLYRRLCARLQWRENASAGLMTGATVLVLLIPFSILLFFLAVELDRLYEFIQTSIIEGEYPTLRKMGDIPFFATILNFLQPLLEDLNIDSREALGSASQEFFRSLVEKAQEFAKNLLTFGMKVFLMVLTLFFVYRDGDRFLGYLWTAIPLPEIHKNRLNETIVQVLHAVVYGVLLTALVQGNLAMAGYWLSGLPSPILLGIATAFASLVPAVGTALIWIPGAAYLLFAGKIFQGIFLLAWGALVVGTSDNLIRPYFISGRGHIPFLVVALGILGGIAAFGFVGIVVGPVILILFFSVLAIYRDILPPEARSGEPPDLG